MHRKCKLFSLIQDELIVENGHCLVYDGLPYQKLDMSSQFKFPAGFMFLFHRITPNIISHNSVISACEKAAESEATNQRVQNAFIWSKYSGFWF